MTRYVIGALLALALAFGGEAAQAQAPDPLPTIETVQIGANGEFIVNGEPFLPIMSWLQHPSNTWNSFANLRSLGFNAFMGNQSGVTPLMQANAAAAVGGYAIARLGAAGDVNAARGHSHLLAWHHSDEPDLPRAAAGGGYEPRTSPANVASVYQQWQNAGIERPVFVTFTSHFMTEFRNRYDAQQQAAYYPAYVQAADVVGYDHYPIFGWGRPNWINRVASGVEQLVELADGRPVYAWIETGVGSRAISEDRQIPVLPEHTRYEVWGSLIRGATGIGYFTHRFNNPSFHEFGPTPAMQAELLRLNTQITELAPAILAAPTDRQITLDLTTTNGSTPLEGHFKATEYEGELYIFAQNMDIGPGAATARQFDPIFPRQALATIHVEGLEPGTMIEVVGTSRTLTAEDGYFLDAFAPLGENIYRIVPEPTTAVLLAAGGLLFLRRRRA
ncbi:MAG: PEP-CTERM sorting domain-containing protein [Phycisphaeraceae bacterium]